MSRIPEATIWGSWWSSSSEHRRAGHVGLAAADRPLRRSGARATRWRTARMMAAPPAMRVPVSLRSPPVSSSVSVRMACDQAVPLLGRQRDQHDMAVGGGRGAEAAAHRRQHLHRVDAGVVHHPVGPQERQGDVEHRHVDAYPAPDRTRCQQRGGDGLGERVARSPCRSRPAAPGLACRRRPAGRRSPDSAWTTWS